MQTYYGRITTERKRDYFYLPSVPHQNNSGDY